MAKILQMIRHFCSRLFRRQHVNWFKTLLFNLRGLPLGQAVRLPVFVYGNTKLVSIGSVRIEAGQVSCGMVRIGTRNFFADGATQWINSGTVVFRGRCLIEGGTCVNNSGEIVMGRESRFCENNKILIVDRLEVGDSTRIAFDTVVMDTDFHTMVNVANGVAKRPSAPVHIGDYNWIGNRCIVKKGTVTPAFTIVSTLSMLNKDYTAASPYLLLGGCPARVLATGWRRLYNWEHGREINDYFKANGGEREYRIPNAETTDWDDYCLHGDDRLPF